ncbi:DNA repair protein [Porphyromonas sp. HMSC077F02]|uniref:TrlF family AAA-like ATPase n=1 Tax=Porphyromonas sp. HMSC077F02 TaxID=1739529 RepID=UPI0008C1BC10|nr:DNA repair protein [Porphyromonas sp. HMSC077F02]OFO56052.1 DNA repair protein [Porphyromonas sp. HMSC077F02]
MNRGSEWRIWDLHFHTPSSYDYKDNSVKNQDIITILSENNVSVVAITDHHVIDIKRIQDLQRLGKEKNIVVLPGIEFCSELGGSEAIHFIGIFPETANLNTIWTKIQGQCNLTPEEINSRGQERIVCPFEKTSSLIIELGGLVTIHAGKKSNSIEGIKNNLLVKQEFKQQLLSTYHPLLEVGKIEDVESYKSHVFPNIQFSLPIIMCSDNHNIREYTTKEKLWIKADMTFEGLKQILFEPEERVRVQSTKPDEKNIYQVIDSITLKEDDFWDGKIFLNPNLNTIIGGRSTGKSSLLKAIAAKHGNKEVGEGDFIRQHLDGVSIRWQDGNNQLGREIEYFRQSYMHEIAFDSEKTNKIVEDIIKSKDENRILENYYTHLTDVSKSVTDGVFYVFQLQKEIDSLKKSLSEKGNRDGVQQQLQLLKTKASALQKDGALTQEERVSFDAYVYQIREKKKLIAAADNDLELLNRLKNLTPFDSSFEKKWDFDKLSFGLNQYEVDRLFNGLKVRTEMEWTEIVQKFIEDTSKAKDQIATEIQTIIASDIYKKGLRIFEDNKELKDINSKIQEEERKLTAIDEIQKKLEQARLQRDESICKVIDNHCSYKISANDICNNLAITYDKLDIRVKLTFHKQEMRVFLETRLNQRGYERQEYLHELLNKYDEDNKAISLDFFKNLLSEKVLLKNGYEALNVVTEFLTHSWYSLDYSLTYQGDNFVNMSEGKQAFVILKLLLDFSDKKCPILIDQPEDSLDNRAIYHELVAYIKRKKKERQIILVTHNSNVVVSADAENVIVANQEGADTPNLGGLKFQYINGALEDTKQRDEKDKYILSSQGIREHICDILEGGRVAFEKREQKYGFRR